MQNKLTGTASVALAFALTLGLAGCATGATSPQQSEDETVAVEEAESTEEVDGEESSEDATAEEEAQVTYHIGDTVSTDLVEITLEDAGFAIAMESSWPFGEGISPSEDHLLTPKEYDSTDDAKNPYVASIGHTLVYLTFSANNLDRSSLPLDYIASAEYGGEAYESWTISADDHWYAVRTDFTHAASVVSNILLSTGGPHQYRGYFDIPVEPSSLDETFLLTLYLPNPDGSLSAFVFEV